MNEKYEIFLDDDCKICNRFGEKAIIKSNNVVIRSNKELTKELFELDSIILINNGQTHSGIDAISHIINNWGGAYKIIKIITYLPRFLTDKLYQLISNHRHQISKFVK